MPVNCALKVVSFIISVFTTIKNKAKKLFSKQKKNSKLIEPKIRLERTEGQGRREWGVIT